MLGWKMLSRLAVLAGPLALVPMASGQDEKPAPRERSVKVTEGRVTVVEDDPRTEAAKHKSRVQDSPRMESRAEARAAAEAARASAEAARAEASATRNRETARTISRMASQARGEGDPLQARLGLELAEADDALRAQLQLPANQGVVVVAVKPDGAASQSGLKVNDVILSLGELKVRGVNPARTRLLSIGKEPIEIKLVRAGQPVQLHLAGTEHGQGFVAEAAGYWIGVPVSPVDATLRSQVADLPAEIGLVANDVVAESPAAKAGVKKYDILVKLGGNPLRDVGALSAQVQSFGDKETPLELFRGGKPLTLSITPVKRSRSTAFNFEMPGAKKGQTFSFTLPKEGVAITDPAQHEMLLKEVDKLVRGSLPGQAGQKPLDIHLEMLTTKAKASADEANAKVESSMKELKASIEELKKAVEALKKPESK